MNWFWKRRREAAEEIQAHIEERADELMEAGMSQHEALQRARRELGNVTLLTETSREVWGWIWLDRLGQDLRYALRVLWRSPGFSVVAILSLALAIGGNTAVFTIVNAFILKPLAVKDISRLYVVGTVDPNNPKDVVFLPTSFPNFQDLRSQNSAFADMASAGTIAIDVKHRDAVMPSTVELVTANYFSVLGIRAALGRTFASDEDQDPSGNFVAVVSHQFWLQRLGADLTIVGQQISLGAVPFTIVGVAQEGFGGVSFGSADQLWVPVSSASALRVRGALDRRSTSSTPIARLRDGITPAKAAAEIKAIGERLAKDYPAENGGRSFRLEPLSNYAHMTVAGSPVTIFAGLAVTAVGLVLVIACINLASLFMARAAYRQREIGVRAALGGNRWRIAQQLLIESIVLSVIAGALGLLVGLWIRDIVWSLRPAGSPLDGVDLSLDARVLAFTATISVFTGLVFGLAPAIRASRSNLLDALHSGGGSSLGGRRQNRVRTFLVVGEVALSLVALICAALFARVLQTAETIDIGYNWKNVASITLDLSDGLYTPDEGRRLYRAGSERLAAAPGVQAVTVQTGRIRFGDALFAEDSEHTPGYRAVATANQSISNNYFAALGIPIIAGRTFNDDDRENSPQVAIIGQATANFFWPGRNAVGRRFHFYGQTVMREVVGVVPDVGFFVGSRIPFNVYLPLQQVYDPRSAFRVRVSGDPVGVLEQLRQIIQSTDEKARISEVKTIRDDINEALRPTRILTIALSASGLIALLLAIIGLYGVLAYSVAQRTPEFGVRMALGAHRWDVTRVVLVQGMRLALMGVVAGACLARGVTPLFARLLPLGVKSSDPFAFFFAALLLLVIALAACLIPAVRATRVSPVIALRYE